MSSGVGKKKKFSRKESSSDSDYSDSDKNSEEFDSPDPKDKDLGQKSKKMKFSSKKSRKLKNSAAQKHQNSITGQDWNGKGKSIQSQPVIPYDKSSQQFGIDDTESNYSEDSELSNAIGGPIRSNASDSLTDSQMEGSEFSEPSDKYSRVEESKAGSGKPSKQAETKRSLRKSGKNKGPTNYSRAQPTEVDQSYSKNYKSKEEKKIAQPRVGKKGGNGKKSGIKARKRFTKKKIDSDDSSSSDDALSQATNKIIQPKDPRSKKQPAATQPDLITFEESPMDMRDDSEENKARFEDLH